MKPHVQSLSLALPGQRQALRCHRHHRERAARPAMWEWNPRSTALWVRGFSPRRPSQCRPSRCVASQLMFRPLICTWHTGSGKDQSLAKASSLSGPLCIPSVASPPSSTSSGFVTFTHQRVRQCIWWGPVPRRRLLRRRCPRQGHQNLHHAELGSIIQRPRQGGMRCSQC